MSRKEKNTLKNPQILPIMFQDMFKKTKQVTNSMKPTANLVEL